MAYELRGDTIVIASCRGINISVGNPILRFETTIRTRSGIGIGFALFALQRLEVERPTSHEIACTNLLRLLSL